MLLDHRGGRPDVIGNPFDVRATFQGTANETMPTVVERAGPNLSLAQRPAPVLVYEAVHVDRIALRRRENEIRRLDVEPWHFSEHGDHGGDSPNDVFAVAVAIFHGFPRSAGNPTDGRAVVGRACRRRGQ